MKVYFISGLGADERVYQFLDLPGIDKTYIQWITPKKNEPLRDYAIRLSEQIDWQHEVVLIGMSFGGLVAQEIASVHKCRKVIIISSVKSPTEYSLPLSFARLTGVYRLVPPSLLKWSTRFIADYYFSTQSKEESRLLHQIIQDTDMTFLAWAIQKLMQWQGAPAPLNLVHIHGNQDHIFPIKPIKNAISIDLGGHFMIVNKSKQMSVLLTHEIKNVQELRDANRISGNS